MTVNDFLLKCRIDIKDNRNFVGNDLEASNSIKTKDEFIDFNSDIESLTNDQRIFIGKYLKDESKDLYSDNDFLLFFFRKKDEIEQSFRED
jgi:hypothetical protein